MTSPTFFLTTKDFTIIEVMRDRCVDPNDPIFAILQNKLQASAVMLRDDIPAHVATLLSRVTFSVDGRQPETRVLSQNHLSSPVGMFLPISTVRGLALLGLSEGQEFVVEQRHGGLERILLHEVQYQPEAARREKEMIARNNAAVSGRPVLRLIQGALSDPSQRQIETGGFDDPGPSAA